MAIYAQVAENECINKNHPFVKDDNLANMLRDNWKTVWDRL